MRCSTARRLTITAADRELGGWRRRGLDRHLAGCAACRDERAETDRVLALVGGLPTEAAPPARLEQEVLRRVRRLADDDAARGWRGLGPSWVRGLVPAVATLAMVVLAVVLTRDGERGAPAPGAPPRKAATADRSFARRRSSPPSEPPTALASQPDLFVDMPIVRNLDKLEHFDAIAGTSMDDDDGDGAPDDPASNG
jgi:putative zinc finger protein